MRGRPLGPKRAWQEIFTGSVDLRLPGRYQRRANVVRVAMSRADARALPELVGTVVGGVQAAIELGEQLAADVHLDLYVSAESFHDLDVRVAFVRDVAGNIALRVVDSAWSLIPPGRFAPCAAVALDLLESGDPRHWIAGEHLGGGDG
jgi:Transcriptional regulator, AbiEi antitoxin, Type IV TA system